ncbi:hypothetical protein [Bartonella bovis]|uniref:Phage related protein n=1 Tax=Bartonella bovis 91-4 TaxID=1094491 RepID=N6VFZ8_9HYPH|nr:hypothetical protein [Bartonella bovis]ENN91151.1 phage related protein [Bartonella bovis 91-4]ENN92690.1 phage related protein [Bartonella bovis 91-4]
MQYAVVENGVVTNIIVAPEDYVYPFEGEAIASNEAQIGWTYKDGQFSPPIEEEAILSIEDKAELESSQDFIEV